MMDLVYNLWSKRFWADSAWTSELNTQQMIHCFMPNVQEWEWLYRWWRTETGTRLLPSPLSCRLQSCTSTVSVRTSWCWSEPSAVSLLLTNSIQLLQFLPLNTLLKQRQGHGFDRDASKPWMHCKSLWIKVLSDE